MNVTKLNFKHVYPKIFDVLKNCDYISLDLEFSGTRVNKNLINTKYDSEELRFFKIQENIKKFTPLQLGLCGFKLLQSSVQFYPMNFYIFPYSNDFLDKKYLFDINSVNFLMSNSFDFNKIFYDGIRYVSLHDYEKNKEFF